MYVEIKPAPGFEARTGMVVGKETSDRFVAELAVAALGAACEMD